MHFLGREYLTPDQLLREIEDELYISNGRIAITELSVRLNVDYVHCESKAHQLSRQSQGEISLVLGQLISKQFKDLLAQEIDLKLQENGLENGQDEDEDENIEQSKPNNQTAYSYLSTLKQLISLRLVDVSVTLSLANSLEKLTSLKSLRIDLHNHSNSDEESFNHFCSALRSLPCLRNLTISSLSAEINKRVYQLLKKLEGLKKIEWLIGECIVSDSGDCLFPIKKGSEEDDEMEDEDEDEDPEIKYMDINIVNEWLQSELGETIIEISPK